MTQSKTALLVLVFSFFLVFLNLNQAAYAETGKGPIQKLSRGVVHLLASPFQLPKEIIQTTGEAETVWLAPWKGFAEGGGRGLYQMGRQGISGLVDIVTFWSPLDRDWGPIFEPVSLFPEI